MGNVFKRRHWRDPASGAVHLRAEVPCQSETILCGRIACEAFCQPKKRELLGEQPLLVSFAMEALFGFLVRNPALVRHAWFL